MSIIKDPDTVRIKGEWRPTQSAVAICPFANWLVFASHNDRPSVYQSLHNDKWAEVGLYGLCCSGHVASLMPAISYMSFVPTQMTAKCLLANGRYVQAGGYSPIRRGSSNCKELFGKASRASVDLENPSTINMGYKYLLLKQKLWEISIFSPLVVIPLSRTNTT